MQKIFLMISSFLVTTVMSADLNLPTPPNTKPLTIESYKPDFTFVPSDTVEALRVAGFKAQLHEAATKRDSESKSNALVTVLANAEKSLTPDSRRVIQGQLAAPFLVDHPDTSLLDVMNAVQKISSGVVQTVEPTRTAESQKKKVRAGVFSCCTKRTSEPAEQSQV